MTANEITKQILDYLILSGHFATRINNIPGTKYRKGNVTRGVPDILGCTRTGRALAVEIKTTDRQSLEQKQYQASFEKRGGLYILAHGLEDVAEKL